MIDSRCRFVPRSLPLSGPDYEVRINRGDPGQNMAISKQGSHIAINHATNPAQNVRLHLGSALQIDRQSGTTVMRQSGNSVTIDRPGIGDDVVISQRGDEIVVDRYGNNNDVVFRRRGDTFEIDRQLFGNDVRVTTRGNQVSIDHYQNHQDALVVNTTGAGIDPVAWQEELTLDPQAWNLVNGWFDRGSLALDDLVTLTETGQVLEWDGLLR